MAVVILSTALNNLYKAQRPGLGVPDTAVLRSALVSDLQVTDFVWGARAKVTAAPASVGGVKTLTLLRQNTISYNVAWPDAATVWILR